MFKGIEEAKLIVAEQNEESVFFNRNFHVDWTFQRLLVGLLVLMPTVIIGGYEHWLIWILILHLMLLTISIILLFPFFHDGSLYSEVNFIMGKEHYKGGFKGYKDGRAIFDFTWRQRVFMCIVGLVLLLWLVFQPLITDYEGINVRNIVLLIVTLIVVGIIVGLIHNEKLKWRKK
jgi:hypothetical protein